jgi:hypothetical protein
VKRGPLAAFVESLEAEGSKLGRSTKCPTARGAYIELKEDLARAGKLLGDLV